MKLRRDAKIFRRVDDVICDQKRLHGDRKINVFQNACFVASFKDNLMLIIFHIKKLAWKSKDFETISFNLLLKYFLVSRL